MKKIITLLCLVAGFSASAQQLTNADFEGSWVDIVPWDSKGNTKKAGTTPTAWKASNVYTTLGEVVVATQGTDNTNYIKLANQSMAGQTVPGYMALGTPWATAETRLTTVRNADGGAFGGIEFTNLPDAIQFDYLRDNSKGAENATMVAYLWKGSTSQADVPGNTAVGIISYGSATKVTMTDRDRNIMGMSTSMGGAVTTSDDFKKIASVIHLIDEKVDTWTTVSAPLEYAEDYNLLTDGTPQKLNVIFSATDYFADRSGIVTGNNLSVDNVKFVYYNTLKSLDYEGATISFDENATSYDLSNVEYDAAKVSYAVKGKGATAESSYDEATAVLSITVKGNDWSESNPNQTIYTIQFMPAKTYESVLTGVSYDGVAVTVDGSMTVDGEYDADKLTLTASEEATIEQSYDEETDVLTITVKGYDIESNTTNYHTYTIRFDQVATETTTFTGKMILCVEGGAMPMEANQIQLVTKTNATKGTSLHRFELHDFVFEGMNIGDIVVDVERTERDGKAIYEGTGALHIEVTGDDVAPVVYAEQVGSDVMGAYIIIPDIASLGNMTMEVYFSPLVAFSESEALSVPSTGVAAVSLTRDFAAGWNTICMPFETTTNTFFVSETNIPSFQEFTGATSSSLTFSPVATGEDGLQHLAANTPYLVYFPEDVIGHTFYMGAKITDVTPVAVTHGAFTFQGNYTPALTMEDKYVMVDSDGVLKLVKGSADETLGSTCAYITGTTDAVDVRVLLDGLTDGVDGIVAVMAENGKVYNMQGQQVTGKNLKKGLYIVNGKKQIIK